MSLLSEIFEQPQVLSNLIDAQGENVRELAAAIQAADPRYVFLAARGTSDNAGRYANYLWGAYNRLPIALAAPSLFTFYQQPPRLNQALVVGISQSGQSPDIVSVLQEGRRQGCLTLAITNEPVSPLAQTADFVMDIHAGEEKAVAASKTYTAELTAIAMISAALAGDEERMAALRQVPGWVEKVLGQDGAISQMVERYRYMRQCVVLGRGFNYATAFEWSLKMKELAYVMAEPYSSADFQHGPIAVVEQGFPVMAVAPGGKIFNNLLDMLDQLRNQFLAEEVIISDKREALKLAQSPIPLPSGIPEWLTPLVAIVAGQMFAHHLTKAKGYDTETPRSIQKVTETH
jgi:glutamine---fructose-6-phosphate transaminase (isomerizing)